MSNNYTLYEYWIDDVRFETNDFSIINLDEIGRTKDLPALIQYEKNTKIAEAWYRKGNLYRKDLNKPVIKNYSPYFNNPVEYYYDPKEPKLLYTKDDKITILHRDPLLTFRSIKIQYVNKNLLCHRDNDLPAQIETLDGKVVKQVWMSNGKQHRDNDKPSYIEYVIKNNKRYIHKKMWKQNNYLYRENFKPNDITYGYSSLTNKNHKISEITRKDDSEILLAKTVSIKYIEFKHFTKILKDNDSLLLTNINSENELIKNYCKDKLGLK